MKVKFRQVQCHKNVTSTKVDPFGPAVSERSLPEFKKETAGHEPNQERQFSTS